MKYVPASELSELKYHTTKQIHVLKMNTCVIFT